MRENKDSTLEFRARKTCNPAENAGLFNLPLAVQLFKMPDEAVYLVLICDAQQIHDKRRISDPPCSVDSGRQTKRNLATGGHTSGRNSGSIE